MTDMLPYTLVTEVCGWRGKALATMREAVATIDRGHALAREAADLASRAHGHAVFALDDRREQEPYERLFAAFDPDASERTWRHYLDARIWTRLMDSTGMTARMDRTAKEQFRESLLTDVPEVTQENIAATFAHLAGDARLIFQRGLARAFSDLDRRFKSHDAFKLGSRIVLTNVFDQWGHWNWRRGGADDTLVDVERVFQILDGHPHTPEIVDAIKASRNRGLNPHQSLTETTYFRIRAYKNGNLHLWFTRDDLVTAANLELADYYGEVLPDAVSGNAPEKELRSKTGALSTDLAFYATPPDVVRRAVGLLHIPPGSRVLEPSAGTGAIVRALARPGVSVDAIEVHPERCAVLRTIPGDIRVREANFLTTAFPSIYSHVVMNPPFSGTHWMEHVIQAYEALDQGGQLVAILPATAEVGCSKKHERFRAWVKARHGVFHDLPAESFASSGTRVSTCMLLIRRRGR